MAGYFVRVLTEPDASLCRQYQALLATEGVEVEFLPEGVRRLAEVAFEVNQKTENIGTRRLHTVMERLLDGVSFEAVDRGGSRVRVDADYVERTLGVLARDEDLSRYILSGARTSRVARSRRSHHWSRRRRASPRACSRRRCGRRDRRCRSPSRCSRPHR